MAISFSKLFFQSQKSPSAAVALAFLAGILGSANDAVHGVFSILTNDVREG
jgi:hypothetical protein